MIRLLIISNVVFALLGLSLASSSFAAPEPIPSSYPNPTVHLKVSDLSHFDTALPVLAKQGQVAIVCEGQPLHLKLTADQTQELAQRINPAGMPLEDAVKWIAAAYDYETQRTGADIFVLTKRYTDPDDLPDIPFDETAIAFQNILTATQNFYPALDNGNAIYNIISTVSDAQRAQLAKGVPISDLDNDQKRDARSLINGIAFRSLPGVRRVALRMQACRSQNAYFILDQAFGVTFPAYQAPFGENGAMWEVALDGWINTETVSSGGDFGAATGVNIVDGKLTIIQPGLVEPTTPRPADQIPAPISSKLRLTLAQAAKQLSDRLAAAHILLSIQTAPPLLPKSLCLAGAQYASPAALVKAIAVVYGLEVQTEGGVETFIQPHPIVLKDPNDILPELQHLLPSPYLRAVAPLQHEDGFATIPAPILFVMEGGMTSKINTPVFSKARASTLYISSVRRLREIVEPEISKHIDQKLPILETNTEAHDMIGLSNLAASLSNFYDISKPVIGYVAHFDDATLVLNQHSDDPQFIDFSVDAPNGKGTRARVAGQIGWIKFRDLAH